MSLTARPIRFTDRMPQHRQVLQALGAQVVSDHGSWVVWQLGSGRLALHEAEGSDTAPGTTTLGWETDDLDGWAERAATAGVAVDVREVDHGRAGVVTGPDGTTFTVDPTSVPTDAPVEASDAGVKVLPIWITSDTAGARRTLVAMGLRERLVGDDGIWTDFTCAGGGLAAVHASDGPSPEVELALEFDGDVETLIEPLTVAGAAPMLVDETYSRTLQIRDPDREGETIWINEKQTDLYGYRQA